MEAMETLLAPITDVLSVSYIVANYPFLSFIALFVLSFGLFILYCRKNIRMCTSDGDMTGKTVLITGGTAGIGKATALDLAKRNARLILACRNMEKANGVADEIIASTGNKNVVVKHLDLASFKTVRKCAEDVLRTEEKLHVLINNAGVWDENRNETEDGCEYILQSNHFGHFLLTMLLLDLLKRSAPSRIINVSSETYRFCNLDLNDLAGKNCKGVLDVYGRSKMANILFTRELASRLGNTSGVTVNSLHPGVVLTDITRKSKTLFSLFWRTLLMFIGRTLEEGAQTTIYLAVHPSLEKTTGKYFMDCQEKKLVGKVLDKTFAEQLFEISEKIVGISPTKA